MPIERIISPTIVRQNASGSVHVAGPDMGVAVAVAVAVAADDRVSDGERSEGLDVLLVIGGRCRRCQR